jgi:hypothetical protein
MYVQYVAKKTLILMFVLFLTALSGCGDSPEGLAQVSAPAPPAPAPPAPTVLSGTLVDGAIGGVSFATPTRSGLTDAGGTFEFLEGESVDFTIGGIDLGSVMGSSLITPVELAQGTSPTDQAVVNLLVLLQSIDADGDHTNGITVSEATRTLAADMVVDFTAAEFLAQIETLVADITDGAGVVVTEEVALQNFYQAIQELDADTTVSFTFPESVINGNTDTGTSTDTGTDTDTGTGTGTGTDTGTDAGTDTGTGTGTDTDTGADTDADTGTGTDTGANNPGAADITFENGTVTYTLTDFGDPVPTATVLGADPLASDNQVAITTKPRGAPLWAGTTVEVAGVSYGLTATNSQITLRVYSPDAGIPVRVKVEDATDPTHSVETEALTTVANAWETLTFDFNNQAAGTAALNPSYTFDKLSIFFNFGTDGDTAGEKIYYWDDVTFVTGTSATTEPPATLAFRATDFEPDGGNYAFGDFGGGVVTVIANPEVSGINTSATVGQMQKFAGEVFGGSTLTLNGEVDFSEGDNFKMKVYATRSVAVLFKLEGLNVERSVTHTGAGWEELSFDFTDSTGAGVTAITLIFDLGVNGAAESDAANWTFYFDDIEQAIVPVAVSATEPKAIDFEPAGGPYAFGDFAGGVVTVIDNPQSAGINTSATVGQMQKFAGEVFGGSTLTLNSAVDFASGAAFTMKVFSSRTVPVLFKLEGLNVERSVTHTGSGWETLGFDFTGSTGPGVDKITLIFDLGVNGAAESDAAGWTFYFDDILQTTP